jgi:hypothetical protein
MKTREVHAYWRWWLKQEDKADCCPANKDSTACPDIAFCVSVCGPIYKHAATLCPCGQLGKTEVIKRVRAKLAKAKKGKAS